MLEVLQYASARLRLQAYLGHKYLGHKLYLNKIPHSKGRNRGFLAMDLVVILATKTLRHEDLDRITGFGRYNLATN